MLLDIKPGSDALPDFASGQLLELRFLLGPLCVIHCRAEVVRKDGEDGANRYGLKIVQIKSDSRARVRDYMDRAVTA